MTLDMTQKQAAEVKTASTGKWLYGRGNVWPLIEKAFVYNWSIIDIQNL